MKLLEMSDINNGIFSNISQRYHYYLNESTREVLKRIEEWAVREAEFNRLDRTSRNSKSGHYRRGKNRRSKDKHTS